MRIFIVAWACVMMLSVIGCQQRSAADQLKADAQKAGKQLDKDIQGMMK